MYIHITMGECTRYHAMHRLSEVACPALAQPSRVLLHQYKPTYYIYSFMCCRLRHCATVCMYCRILGLKCCKGRTKPGLWVRPRGPGSTSEQQLQQPHSSTIQKRPHASSPPRESSPGTAPLPSDQPLAARSAVPLYVLHVLYLYTYATCCSAHLHTTIRKATMPGLATPLTMHDGALDARDLPQQSQLCNNLPRSTECPSLRRRITLLYQCQPSTTMMARGPNTLRASRL